METLITYDARDGNTYSVPCNDEKKSSIKELLWITFYHLIRYIINNFT